MGEFSKHLAGVMSVYQMKESTLAKLMRVPKKEVKGWTTGSAVPNDDQLCRYIGLFKENALGVMDMVNRDRKSLRASDAYSLLIARVRKLPPEQAISLCEHLMVGCDEERKAPLQQTADLDKAVKICLAELGRSHSWLIEQVKERTGLYFDGSYLYKIRMGKLKSPKILEAICEILGLEKEHFE